MKKTTKGAIAIGAASLLLLGGGGTFALWNASETFTAGSVVSGELSLAQSTGATSGWFNQGAFDAAHAAWVTAGSDPLTEPELADFPIADIATYQVVPGDLLVYVVDSLVLTASGSNLYYTFESSGFNAATAAADGYVVTVDAEDITDITDPLNPVAATELPNSSILVAGTDGDFTGAGPVASGKTVYAYSSTTAKTVEFKMTLTVDFDNLNPQTEFGETLNLSTLAYNIQQVVKA